MSPTILDPSRPSPPPERGDIRVVGGRAAFNSAVLVWCGEPAGWVPLRGVVAIEFSIDARGRGEPRAKVVLENLLFAVKDFDAFVEKDRLALEISGVTPAMAAAAQAAYDLAMAAEPRARTKPAAKKRARR